jgi:hypothetical protein
VSAACAGRLAPIAITLPRTKFFIRLNYEAWVMPLFSNFSRNVMACDDPVKDHNHNENNNIIIAWPMQRTGGVGVFDD